MSDASLFPEAHPARYGAGRRAGRLLLPRLIRDEHVHLSREDLAAKHAILVRWADLEETGRLLARNEVELQSEFLTQVFGEALGYTLFSANRASWHLWPQFPVNGGSADAAIGGFSHDAPPGEPVAVIELKGPTVNLDRDRSQGRTPVQQCWDYLNALPQCPWGIVCNYVSFRLYHRERTPRYYELFTLQDLRQPETFQQFYCVFGEGAFLPFHRGAEARCTRLLRLSGERQREVGDELYDRYSQERYGLITHLQQHHQKSVDAAIRIAQKLLDRVVFIAFCEDRGLLPAKSLESAHDRLPAFSRAVNPRWQNFKQLFESVDRGNERFGISAYNGGLFRRDDEVDDLELADDRTRFFKGVGGYDFRDEVSVDVLGHLFEKSITELEKLRGTGFFDAHGNGNGDGPALMPKSAERRRFGVYYTPPEFTDLLVRETLRPVVEDRYTAVDRQHGVLSPEALATLAREKQIAVWTDRLAALRRVRVCDPACGSGAFLIRAFDALEEMYEQVCDRLRELDAPDAEALGRKVPEFILADNLFGVDLSAQAADITRLSLWIRSAEPGRSLADLSRNIVHGNSLVDDPEVDPLALDWSATFPDVFRDGGFDCVIGNPPWERLKLQEREFFSLSAPGIASAVNAAKRRELIAKLRKKDPDLFERYTQTKARADATLNYARNSGRYPLTGRGDINTYMLFAELATKLVAPRGRVGILVPSGIATDDTTKEFFASLVVQRSLVLLYDFENRKRVFPDVDGRFKFCALVFGGNQLRTKRADFVFFAHEIEDLKQRRRHIELSADDLALLNPNTRTCPIFRTRRDAELTKRIYQRILILIDANRKQGGNPWGIRFVRMFDQTNDAELFRSPEELKSEGYKLSGNRWKKGKSLFLPLYEAKMVQAYDHRAAGVFIEKGNWVRQGQTRPTSLVQHQNPEFEVQPRWWVEASVVQEALAERVRPAYLCYKDVTSPTNQRTMIAAFIPHVAVANSAPLVLFDPSLKLRLACCLLANLNALALDFVARQKVGNVHLNFFIVEQFPVLPPSAYAEKAPWSARGTLEKWISDRVLKLTCTSNDMKPLAEAAGFTEAVHPWNPDERARLIAELDAAYFILYGIERDDVQYILSTFQGLDDSDAGLFAGNTPTERILAAYDSLRGA